MYYKYIIHIERPVRITKCCHAHNVRAAFELSLEITKGYNVIFPSHKKNVKEQRLTNERKYAFNVSTIISGSSKSIFEVIRVRNSCFISLPNDLKMGVLSLW